LVNISVFVKIEASFLGKILKACDPLGKIPENVMKTDGF
jgi:hypothetical protein